MLTLLHTSDWHLGRRLYGKPRYEEFKQFLDWQIEVIKAQKVDVLLIAGDIFDTSSPSHQAQNLYYDFLYRINQTTCRHIIIVAGNHDSPNFLEAPKALLKAFNIYIIGSINENFEDEILVLKDALGVPELIVAAVPYLRDRDVRQVVSGERIDDKEHKLISGISQHYKLVTQLAIQCQQRIEQQYQCKIPMVATGHLFTAGGKTIEGDGVRELYIGSLAHVTTDIFDPCFDYIALGHLHVPQIVGDQPRIRYSGSPLAMGFGESRQQKQVHLVRFQPEAELFNAPLYPLVSKRLTKQNSCVFTKSNTKSAKPNKTLELFSDSDTLEDDDRQDFPTDLTQPYNLSIVNDSFVIQSLAVPTFQLLYSIKGDWQTIKTMLTELKAINQPVWLEITYNGNEIKANLQDEIKALVQDSLIEVLRLKNLQKREQALHAQHIDERLEELDEQQVFERCLTVNHVLDEQKPILRARYHEVLEALKDSE